MIGWIKFKFSGLPNGCSFAIPDYIPILEMIDGFPSIH